MLPTGSTVDLYWRVSTDGQEELGSSLDVQPEVTRAVVARLGLSIGVEEDEGGASSKTLHRPALQRLLARLDSGESRGIVVAHSDRLTRNLRDACELLDRHFTAPGGCWLITSDGYVDTRTAKGRLIFYVLMVFSQFMRESGVERTAEVQQSKLGRGQLIARAKRGFRVDPTGSGRSKTDRPIDLVADPAYQLAQARAVELRRDGETLRQICVQLDAEQLPPPRGGKWAPSSVRQLLADHADLVRARAVAHDDSDPTVTLALAELVAGGAIADALTARPGDR